jgi:hypothetical protein
MAYRDLVLLVAGLAAVSFALFQRNLVTLFIRSLREIVSDAVPGAGKPPATPLVPDPDARPAQAPSNLPRRYDLTGPMRLFCGVVGTVLLGLGGAGVTIDLINRVDGGGGGSAAPATTTALEPTDPTNPDGGGGGGGGGGSPPITCPPVPDDAFELGGYYSLEGGGTVFQVVDPAGGGDPSVSWIDRAGLPVINPAVPLGPEAVAVAEAFGSAKAAVDFNRCGLRPLGTLAG